MAWWLLVRVCVWLLDRDCVFTTVDDRVPEDDADAVSVIDRDTDCAECVVLLEAGWLGVPLRESDRETPVSDTDLE